jgi:hypothetical protein
MSINKGLFSSAKSDWRTPRILYTRLLSGRFDVSDRHGGTFNAMVDIWPDQWYCNPPYGREIANWTCQMETMSQAFGRRGVALLPARTDTKWFHTNILPYARLEFIKGRLHFNDNGPAPFPSMLAWFE